MTRNQLHGKKFEDQIKGCGLFSGASDTGRSVTSGMDIEARFDKIHGLPTSIKTTGGNVVTLSDARRFWAIDYPFRMLVGSYRQMADVKQFDVVHEFLLAKGDLADLKGDVVAAEVERLHSGIGQRAFPLGMHREARVWMGGQKRALTNQNSKIILNAKIDSQSQRRLQCSVRLTDLVSLTEAEGTYVRHDQIIGDLLLPIRLRSSQREFNK
jgi:hypothetical protein